MNLTVNVIYSITMKNRLYVSMNVESRVKHFLNIALISLNTMGYSMSLLISENFQNSNATLNINLIKSSYFKIFHSLPVYQFKTPLSMLTVTNNIVRQKTKTFILRCFFVIIESLRLHQVLNY